jgi:hypothetical protein
MHVGPAGADDRHLNGLRNVRAHGEDRPARDVKNSNS